MGKMRFLGGFSSFVANTKIVLFFSCLIFLVPAVVFAQSADGDIFSSSIFYRGDVSFDLEKKAYLPGDVVSADVTVYNLENFPLVDSFLVFDVVAGGAEHVYPSQSSDADNVLFEKVVGGIDLAANGKKTVHFFYTIPMDQRSGTYRLEAYYGTKRTPVVGIPAIFISPKYAVFSVEGSGEFPNAFISRTKTMFINETGPIGVGVAPGSAVNGSVYIENRGSSGLGGYSLVVTVCEWDDSSCAGDEIFWSKKYDVPATAPGEAQKVVVLFDAPVKPSAYAIRLELADAGGRMVSLYRSRIVVMGATLKIRKLALDKAYAKEGGNATIMILVGASPDHYTMPVVKNASLSVSVYGLDGGDAIYSGSSIVPEISMRTQGFVSKAFFFNVPREMKGFKVCSKVESNAGELYDSFCYSIDSASFGMTENVIKTSWESDAASGLLKVGMCSEDVSGIASKTSSAVIILDGNGNVAGSEENVALDPCGSASFNLGPGSYVLLVNDLGSGAQMRYDGVVVSSAGSATTVPLVVCGDGKCDSSESADNCCVDCDCPVGSECSGGLCVLKTPGEQPANAGIDGKYYIAAVLLLIVAVLLYIFMVRRK